MSESTGDPPFWWSPLYAPSMSLPVLGSPRTLPVNLPFPELGLVTIATLDSAGNVTIRVDQPHTLTEAAVAALTDKIDELTSPKRILAIVSDWYKRGLL